MTVRDRLLGTKVGYTTFRRVIKADRNMQTLIDEYFRLPAGSRLLDVGCGTGDLAALVPGVKYVGVDHNPAYVGSDDAAVDESPRFVNADLADLGTLDLGTFETAVAVGVLHHLDDELATAMVASVRDKLAPGGRFVTSDPVFHPDQRTIARVLMALDRGRFVRHPADYARLMGSSFPEVKVSIRHDLLPFPYTHCVIEASG
jgi:SAM-dependent methyltransferase